MEKNLDHRHVEQTALGILLLVSRLLNRNQSYFYQTESGQYLTTRLKKMINFNVIAKGLMPDKLSRIIVANKPTDYVITIYLTVYMKQNLCQSRAKVTFSTRSV